MNTDFHYNKVVSRILNEGQLRPDRTGVGTQSLFGVTTQFDLLTSFPLITSKEVNFKAIIAELLWFLEGSTSSKRLNELGSKIWDEWALHGELGPIYGKQWVDWENPKGKNINQIKELIKEIKRNPYSRRHILNAWNPVDLPDPNYTPQENVALGKAALAPCHVLCQFYVSDMDYPKVYGDIIQWEHGHLNEKRYRKLLKFHTGNDDVENKRGLSAFLYIRSNDVMLGMPFNIASYASLTYMIAKVCDLVPLSLYYSIGDAHIYQNHIEKAKEQISRSLRKNPQLQLNKKEDIFSYSLSDFKIKNYDPHEPIKYDIAV